MAGFPGSAGCLLVQHLETLRSTERITDIYSEVQDTPGRKCHHFPDELKAESKKQIIYERRVERRKER